MSMITTLMSRMDSLWLNTQTGLGGNNDPHATTGVNVSTEILAPTTLFQLYANNGVISRACNIRPRLAVKNKWRVDDSSLDPDPMATENRRLNIFNRFLTAGIYSQIFGGGYILIVTSDDIDDDGNVDMTKYNPSEPLTTDNVGTVVNLIPMTTLECTPMEYETLATNPNYGRPRFWSCTPFPFTSDTTTFRVHHTRVLYIPGVNVPNRNRSNNRGADFSIIQAAYDNLKSLGAVDASVGTYVQRLNRDVIKYSGLNAVLSGDQASQFPDKMSLMMRIRSTFGLMVLDAQDEIDNQPASIAGFADLSDHAKDAICAAFGLPRIVLFGEAPGGLNSDGDSGRGNMQAEVEVFQSQAFEQSLHFLYRLLYAQKKGPFKGKIPKNFTIVFNPIGTPTPTEVAQIQKVTAETDAIYIQSGVYTPEEVRRGRFGPSGWSHKLPPLTTPESKTEQVEETIVLSEHQINQIQTLMERVNEQKLLPQQARVMLMLIAPSLPINMVTEILPNHIAAPAGTTEPKVIEAEEEEIDEDTDEVPLAPKGKQKQIEKKEPKSKKDSVLPIVLEYEVGETRSGISDDGTPWSVEMPCGYGYLEGVPGLDGDDADVLVVGEDNGTIFVVEHRFSDGALDEYKAVIGVNTVGEAINLYNEVYGPVANYGKVHPVPSADIVKWLTESVEEIAENEDSNSRTDAAPAKYAHINFKPPVSVASEAQRGLQWRAQHGRGGTVVGVARARDLSNRKAISPQTIRRMVSYFARHHGDRRGRGYASGPGFPSAGRIAWALWGGDAGRAWANKVSAQMKAADK